MKTLLTFLFSISICISAHSQNEWQEFLSHERYSTISNGHLLIDGQMHIANLSSVDQIIGNQKPDRLMEFYAYMYQRIKTTRTGVNSKELLLLEAFDYDISGLGFMSFRNNNGIFWGKEQFGYEDFDTDFQILQDGILSPSGEILDQAIRWEGDLVKLENGMLDFIDPSPVEAFHEGLNDQFYAIKLDTLFSYTDQEMIPVFNFESTYDFLDNDPYTNSLLVINGKKINWYSYDDFSLTNSLTVESEFTDIQLIESAVYTLVKTANSYDIQKYLTDQPAIETYFSLPIDENPGFDVKTFEVDGEDIYLVGNSIGEDSGIPFHYVQKHTLGEAFAPKRQDLALDTFSIIKINDQEWDNHSYTFTVRNNGTEQINSFAISSRLLPVFQESFSYIRMHFDTTIEPGEFFSFTDTIGFFFQPNQITLKISGVNYGYDGNIDNNSYTADVISLSSSNITNLAIDIYPNPTSNILNIKGEIDHQAEVQIYDIAGQIVNYNKIGNNTLDISNLLKGQYYLSIRSDKGNAYLPFNKI